MKSTLINIGVPKFRPYSKFQIYSNKNCIVDIQLLTVIQDLKLSQKCFMYFHKESVALQNVPFSDSYDMVYNKDQFRKIARSIFVPLWLTILKTCSG